MAIRHRFRWALSPACDHLVNCSPVAFGRSCWWTTPSCWWTLTQSGGCYRLPSYLPLPPRHRCSSLLPRGKGGTDGTAGRSEIKSAVSSSPQGAPRLPLQTRKMKWCHLDLPAHLPQLRPLLRHSPFLRCFQCYCCHCCCCSPYLASRNG